MSAAAAGCPEMSIAAAGAEAVQAAKVALRRSMRQQLKGMSAEARKKQSAAIAEQVRWSCQWRRRQRW